MVTFITHQQQVLIRLQVLCKAFQHYDGFQMGKMIKNRLNNKNKGAACTAPTTLSRTQIASVEHAV